MINAVDLIYKEMPASVRTDPTSAEDTPDESSDWTGLDTQGGDVLEEKEVTGKEEEEVHGNEKEGNEGKGNEKDETVSNDDMEHIVIEVVPGRPRRSRS